MAFEQQAERHSFLHSQFPVFLPELPELRLSASGFEDFLKRTAVFQTSVSSDIDKLAISSSVVGENVKPVENTTAPAQAPFMDALLSNSVPSLDEHDGKMLTENGDVTYRTSGNVLVDLFTELETVITAARLRVVLERAWKDDANATLRLIWNSRSIHLGKSDKITFYRAAGWLAQNHPRTFLVNLEWLVRPVIQKKVPKKRQDGENEKGESVAVVADDFEVIDTEETGASESPSKKRRVTPETDSELPEFQVKYGVSHGYWKDLLNILALAARGKLTVNITEEDIHCVLEDDAGEKDRKKRDWTLGRKKALTEERHKAVIDLLEMDNFYRALHVSVARIFSEQLRLDMARISGSESETRLISLCGKWAPTSKKSHDRHTFIVSSTAELLYPFDQVCPDSTDPTDRFLYLKYARQAYQTSTLSKLRKHLDVVERPISENRFEDIKYERVPSLAMNQYTSLFIKKDEKHFEKYIDNVAAGKARISGATLLPSTLVHSVRGKQFGPSGRTGKGVFGKIEARKSQIEQEIATKAVDGQWKTLCQRIQDSGKLESSIAVCDVSGSMQAPVFKDGTCPMDSAIGLSLLVAEVTQAPFGGAFITFSEEPQVVRAGGRDDKRTFQEKVAYIERSNWSMSTDFVAVFEKLLLPMAVKHNVKPEDMVKQVFVFSDMQFNQAESSKHSYNRRSSEGATWSTSFVRIKKKFNDAGYELPRLIFWNLAGGRGDRVASKPVTADEDNTVLVSGYSQGQLKMFLENGSFEDDAEEVVEDEESDDGTVVLGKKKKSMDSVAVMRKAISHDAYRMLKVVD
ncbi:hypothetical protein BKA67DRAFT_673030 [Truncatella angustata]|uniref:Formamidopyrimidine-DNA glycosylase catalytic domain-containing protein n=1 Tax=Truncatella angustata TaxID=152316 RepID=A0A9P8US01_9PEZI|nr:uncharacterized protein BKA67DRAFT_673030 [Truncatella angustata]KAH6657236.1 hypothetical protein BKA67DRAFT_673030 [Truncatella angustata]